MQFSPEKIPERVKLGKISILEKSNTEVLSTIQVLFILKKNTAGAIGPIAQAPKNHVQPIGGKHGPKNWPPLPTGSPSQKMIIPHAAMI